MVYLQILKIHGTIFLLVPFFKYFKSILTNLKKPNKIFLLIPFFKYLKYLRQFFKYLKKHTSKFQNTFFILIIILKETIYIKNHYKNNSHKNHHKHKAKYIITACIPKVIIKNFLLFCFTVYRNERKEHKF